jgi:hypothetical protein
MLVEVAYKLVLLKKKLFYYKVFSILIEIKTFSSDLRKLSSRHRQSSSKEGVCIINKNCF